MPPVCFFPLNSAFTSRHFMRGRGVWTVPLLLLVWSSLFLELASASAVSDGGDGAMALVLAQPCAAYARDLAASFDKKRLAEGVRTALGGKCERSGGRDEGAGRNATITAETRLVGVCLAALWAAHPLGRPHRGDELEL